MRDLGEHLALYGIRHFDSELDWRRVKEELDEDRAARVDAFREEVLKPAFRKQPREVARFYDGLADPALGAVIHSLKADQIRASGVAVESEIQGRKRILDLGCATGYLTTWYAYRDGGRKVLGVDFSERCILEACRKAGQMRRGNVEFRAADILQVLPEGSYDAIVDTQCVYLTGRIDRAFRNIVARLSPDGIFVSVPVLETARHAERYIGSLTRSGLKLLSFGFLYYLDCGRRGACPVLVAGKSGCGIKAEVREAYVEAETWVGKTGFW